MEVKEMLSMKNGDGENSYAKSSRFTQQVAASSQPIIYRAVQSFFKEKLSSKSVELLNVADLGCAAGPNTFTVMSTVIESTVKICSELGTKIPEIQFYLNDLVGNDFNTLFKGLSVIEEKYKKDKVSCFAMGAPGSFHARLFPANSIHLVHSSYGVHWLSKAPKITGEGGLPLNKGKIYISDTSPPQVREVYHSQFQQDFISFLESRFPELVVDGRMVLIIHGRRSQDPEIESSYTWEVLAEAISYLVSQGVIEEEKLDSFNVPYYIPTQEEVKGLVEEEGSFTVEFMETYVLELQGTWPTPEFRAKSARAFTEPIISHQFGVDVMDKLYDKVAEIMVQHSKQGNELIKGFPLVLELRKKKLKPQT